MVLLATGALVSIARVHVGDKVEATDPMTGKNSVQTVTATIKTLTDSDFTDVTIKDAHGVVQTITSTQGHPYWDVSRHIFVQAALVTRGDRLSGPDGSDSAVVSVTEHESHTATYNLTASTRRVRPKTPFMAQSPPLLGHHPTHIRIGSRAGAR
ncbi:polymorphic toxin-type HINT domain-containing protein [Fodinicola feengrottensis]